MPIQSIERVFDTADPPVEIGIIFRGVGRTGSFSMRYSDVTGTRNRQWVRRMTNHLQNLFDVRIPLDDPEWINDEDALTDPARTDYFHDSNDLVFRKVIISDVAFTNGVLIFVLTRARR